jgi:hypothetical protein
MTTLGSTVTAAIIQKITAPGGMNANLAALNSPSSALAKPVDPAQIQAQNVAVDLEERSNAMKYPSLNVYCEKIVNSLTEKFRTFSGSVEMAIEVHHSQDRLEGLQSGLELYVDSVTQVLDAGRGDWGNGMYYTGGYEVALGAVKHGGRNFIQSAKITFQIGVSRS